MADRLTFIAAFVLLPLSAVAEELPDPTRPPSSIVAPAGAGAATGTSPSPALQSIIISKSRRAAIIDGETVELGGKYGDAKLIEVNEGGIVLRGAQGRQVMTLFPGVEMKMAGNGKPVSGVGVSPAARKERK